MGSLGFPSLRLLPYRLKSCGRPSWLPAPSLWRSRDSLPEADWGLGRTDGPALKGVFSSSAESLQPKRAGQRDVQI